jgi:hypothetical protein
VPDLRFVIEGAQTAPFAAAPQLAFQLRIDSTPADRLIQTIALRCQIQLEPSRRRYSAAEQRRLFELFGEPDRWSRTLRSMLWTHAQTVVPRFAGGTVVDLPVPCTFDFNVAATKYFAGLDAGDLPLNFLFSGTVFFQDDAGALQVMQISWDTESRYRLPVKVWADMMAHYYPESAWLRVRRDVFEQLADYKRRHGFATWDQALGDLLASATATVPR